VRKVLLASMTLAVVLAASPAWAGDVVEEGKVWVCKYVGTPGVDETLQTGDNPISVSVNATGGATVGEYFADGQGRSYVLAVDDGGPEPPVTDCPEGDTPPPPPPPEEFHYRLVAGMPRYRAPQITTNVEVTEADCFMRYRPWKHIIRVRILDEFKYIVPVGKYERTWVRLRVNPGPGSVAGCTLDLREGV